MLWVALIRRRRHNAAMNRAQTIDALKRHEADIRARGVTRLALFGSTARDEAGPESDVDVLVDVDDAREPSFTDVVDLQLYLKDLLGREVEVTTRKGLKPFLKDNILAEAVEIFPEFGKRDLSLEGKTMPKRSPRQHLEDMLESILAIEGFVAGKSFDDYLSNLMLRPAVERSVEIISEASRRLPEDLKSGHAGIPWKDIAGVGNVLRHGYRIVDHEVLWGIATRDLAPLKGAVEAMIRDVDRREGR